MDVFKLLKKDHRTVEQLFEKLQTSDDAGKKAELRDQLALELLVHAKAEERCFYPQARQVGEAKDDVKDGLEEHQQVEKQVKQLLGMDPDDDGFDDLLQELQECVDHHVNDEENELFPTLEEHWDRARQQELAEEVQSAKEELQRQDLLSEARGRRAASRGGKRYQASERTRRELYERAKQLDIQGRSKMTKDELIKALEDAES